VASVSATRNPLAVGHNAQGEKVTGELPASASRDRSGSPTAAVAGILVLAVLAAGGYVAYRRRRTDTG
jgi:LPXTG-motif cell wall-anchored protein